MSIAHLIEFLEVSLSQGLTKFEKHSGCFKHSVSASLSLNLKSKFSIQVEIHEPHYRPNWIIWNLQWRIFGEDALRLISLAN